MSRIAIVGSGLAGISAAKALKKRGIKPTILDVGYEIEEEIGKLVNKLGGINTSEWKQQDVEKKFTIRPYLRVKGYPKNFFLALIISMEVQILSFQSNTKEVLLP